MSTAIARNFQIGIDPTPTNNFTLYQPATPDGTLRLGNGNTGITSSLLTLTSAGNLGIGTSSPVARLGVNLGTATSNGAPASWDSTYAVFGAAGSVSGSAVGLGFGSQGGVLTSLAPSNAWQTMNYLASSHVFYRVNAVEAMRIDSSGNLGLGVTPSAWNSGVRMIEFVGAAIGSNNTPAQMYLASNAILDSGGWKYKASNFAAKQEIVNGQFTWATAPSGTAGNAISFTQAMTLDASGNLGVGTTSPSSLRATIEGSGAQLRIRNSTNRYRSDYTVNNVGTGEINVYDDTGSVYMPLLLSANTIQFATGSGSATERARIDSSGNLLVGTASVYDANYRMQLAPAVGTGVMITRASGATHVPMGFQNSAGTFVGNISCTNTATTYATSSDYRLKENIQPMHGALARVAALKPCTYKWKADGSDGEGFIAHELAEVVPQCVTGEKDAVDADGNPQYQGIDTSFLVATLTAAIQELKAEFDAYKATHP